VRSEAARTEAARTEAAQMLSAPPLPGKHGAARATSPGITDFTRRLFARHQFEGGDLAWCDRAHMLVLSAVA
jgi:hypothetical protein